MIKKIRSTSLPLRIIIVTVVDIAVTDSVFYYHLNQHPEHLTIPFLIATILITILPIAAVLLYWLYQNRKQHN